MVLAPGVIGRGLAAHYTAEALLNAAALVGSLDLLLNPTGLAASLSAGLRDLLSLPLAALQARSPTQVPLPASCRIPPPALLSQAPLSLSISPTLLRS